MKILHTSDWHLGQSFIGKSREREHQEFLEWLLEQVKVEQVDAVIVAGDIFDTGTPPSYARAMYNQFVLSMSRANCQLVILGGNHDSVSTLHESACLLESFGTKVIGGVKGNPVEQVVTLNARDGKPGALLCAIPFIRPRDVVVSQAGQGGIEKQQALLNGMAGHFEAVYQEALLQRETLSQQEGLEQPYPLPIIATGHLTTLASSCSDSVRDIYVGTLESFPSDRLPPADYVALGHIHKPMSVSGHEHIRYSGSPIHLSFDELGHEKQVQVVQFEPNTAPQISSITIPRFQPMFSVSGDLEQLEVKLNQIALSHTNEQSCEVTWVEVLVETDDYLSDLQQRVEALVEDKPIEILRIRRSRTQYSPKLQIENKQSLSELTPDEVFSRRLGEESFDEDTMELLTTTFKQVVAEIETDDTELGNDTSASGQSTQSESASAQSEEFPV